MKNTMILSGIAAAAATAAIFGLAPAPTAAPAPAVAKADAAAFRVDPVHSTIVFRIRHSDIAPFYGRFTGINGDFTLDNDNPGSGHVNITVDAATVDTANKQRDDHLRSSDFFNANQFPEITFRSTKVEPGQGDTFKVTGDFTLHGVTKPVTIEVEKAEKTTARGTSGGLATEFTIKRSDYDMTYGIDGNALGDEVTLQIGIEGAAG
jgi:polyisoprenoid-binding protein YceI